MEQQNTPIFEIGQIVYVKYHKDNKFYPACIVDIERAPKYIDRRTQSDEYEFTGRYGVKFTDVNPTIIDIPYFWKHEIYATESICKSTVDTSN